eukprot:637625-Rhodomonas_salina.1
MVKRIRFGMLPTKETSRETQDHRRDHEAMVECSPGSHRAPQLGIADTATRTPPKRRMADHPCKSDHVGGDGVPGAPARS